MLKEKLDDLEQFASTMDKLITWNDHSCCHLFYIYDVSDKKEEKTEAFKYFIVNNIPEKMINVFSINDLKLLSDDEKLKYYNKDYINIIDCSDLDINNIYIFNNLYDNTKATNANFVYYTNIVVFTDFILSTEQFKLRSHSSFSSLDQDMVAFKAYHDLNDKIENKIDHIPIKKKKI